MWLPWDIFSQTIVLWLVTNLEVLAFPSYQCTFTFPYLQPRCQAVSVPNKHIPSRQKPEMTYTRSQIVHDRLVSNKIISLFLLLLKIKVILIL